MMFLPTNMDILLFKKQTTGRQTLNGYKQQIGVTILKQNTLRDNWTKTVYDSTEKTQAQQKTKEKTLLTDKKLEDNKLYDNTLKYNMAHQDNNNTQTLSIKHSIGAKEVDLATGPDKPLKLTSLSQKHRKILNQQQASAVSNINYYLPLSDNFTNKMASTLKQAITESETSKGQPRKLGSEKRKSLSPSPRGKKENCCIDPPSPKRNGEWTEVSTTSTQGKKHKADVIDDTESFPTSYPARNRKIETNKEPEQEQFQKTGVNIKIKIKTTTNLDDSKMIRAILECFQMRDPWAQILPKVQGRREQNMTLHTTDHITQAGNDLADYIEAPLRKVTTNEYMARIWVQSSIPFYQITKDDKVQQWLRQEKVHLEENNLTQSNVMNVGFLGKANTRAESQKLYELRLKSILPDNLHEFHIIKSSIFTETLQKNGMNHEKENDIKSKVLMIRAGVKNASEISAYLTAIDDPDIHFYSWNEYRSLETDKKRTVVVDQNCFHQQYKSFTLPFFKAEVRETSMHLGKNMEGLQIQEDTTLNHETKGTDTVHISKFLLQHYKSGNGTSLFSYIFPPINGIIEAMVTKENFVEAQTCMQMIEKDLQFHCTPEARELIFLDSHHYNSSLSNYKGWQPFNLCQRIKPTNKYNPEPGSSYNNHTTDSTDNYNTVENKFCPSQKFINSKHPSYSAAATFKKTVPATNTPQSISTSDITFTSDEYTEITEIRAEYKDIKKSMKLLETSLLQQVHENKKEMEELLEASESRQSKKFDGVLNHHTNTLMEQMQQITILIQNGHRKSPPNSPTKPRAVRQRKRSTYPSPLRNSETEGNSETENIKLDRRFKN